MDTADSYTVDSHWHLKHCTPSVLHWGLFLADGCAAANALFKNGGQAT